MTCPGCGAVLTPEPTNIAGLNRFVVWRGCDVMPVALLFSREPRQSFIEAMLYDAPMMVMEASA